MTSVNAMCTRTATVVTLAMLVSCGGGDSGGGGGAALDPRNPGAGYSVESDPANQAALVQSMFQSLSTPPCWSGAFITNPGVGGSAGSVAQFEFFGQGQYRFVGTSTFSGTIGLASIGTFQGLRAAIVSTWTGVDEGIVIIDGSTFNHSFPNVGNTAIVVTTYRAVSDSSRCL